MSKKNIPKKNNKDEKKQPKKKSKIITDEDDFNDADLYDELEFMKEIEEKNELEREIKGEKKPQIKQMDREAMDIEINKNINKEAEKEPQKVNNLVKKTRKDTLVDSVLDAYKKLDLPAHERLTEAQLRKEKINILEKKLSDLTELIVSKIATKTETMINNNTVSSMSNELCVDALFNVNLILTSFLENVAETGRKFEVTKKYIPNISGLTKKLLVPEKEKRLRECLTAIVKEHGESIKPYMSPVAVWLMYMITTTTEVISDNMSKNSQEAINI